MRQMIIDLLVLILIYRTCASVITIATLGPTQSPGTISPTLTPTQFPTTRSPTTRSPTTRSPSLNPTKAPTCLLSIANDSELECINECLVKKFEFKEKQKAYKR